MSAFITVIVPVYNIEEYLNRCIDSILNQTYTDFELILVDDGSTDDSGTICDEYVARDRRVRVLHKQNGGSSSARNMAISLAEGEYLSFVDSDDYLEPDFLEELVHPIFTSLNNGEKPPQIIQIGRDEIDEDGVRIDDICIPPVEEEIISSKDFFKSLIMHIGDCSFCTKLFAKGLFEGRQFPEGKLNEDFFLLIHMLSEVNSVVSLPGYKYHVFYRMGSNSRRIGKNDFSRVFKDCVDNADVVEQIVYRDYPELAPVAIRFALYQRMEYLLHIPITYMNNSYEGYSEVVGYIRRHFFKIWPNEYLTLKNKVYLTLFSIAPRGIRKVHARIKHLK